jgi:hypothetical protein
MPSDTESVEDASEGKAPTKGEMVPRLAAVECDKCEGDGCKFCNNGVKKAEYQPKTGQPCTCKPGAQRDNCPQCEGTGQRIDFKAIREQNKKGSATAVFETPITNVGPGTEAHDEANQRTEGYKDEKDVPKAVINSAPIGIALDETGVPRRPEEERKGKSAAYGDRRDFPKIDIFVSGKYVASTTWASNIKEAIQKYEEKNPGPWAGEVKAQYDKRGSDKQAKRVEGFTSTADIERLAAQTQEGDLSASASAALDGVRKGGKEAKEALEKHADKMMEYASSMSQDNQAHHAVADHKKEIAAGKHGPTPLSISSSKKGAEKDADTPEAISDHLKENVSQARQGKDALKDHHASFDAAKWGGLGKKQASSLWVGTAKKVAAEFDEFTRGYIETALWSSTDESDPSGGEPMDKNYDIRDLAPSCLQAMTEDCAKFQAENAELLAAASEQDGQDDFRQGHDFWLTRCGHGAGYWDGDYPTTGDGLTEASKAFGNVDIYVGDDDMIYQYGSEDIHTGFGDTLEREHNRQEPTSGFRDTLETEQNRDNSHLPPPVASKRASKKTASQNDASYIASLIGGGFGGEDYDARSQHSRTAAQKREDEMARKYSSQRKKFADVPQDIDDIWSETMEDMGPAPEIRLPGESKDNEKSTTGEHEIEAPAMSEASRSDVPEQVKGDQEEPTVKVEEALENDTTKSEEDKPSTGEGGASADSKETKSEKSEGGSQSEWAKNRNKGKSEKKEDEPKEEEPKEEKDEESKTAARPRPARQRVRCDQCEMLSINGTATHETGCPNQNSRWDADRQDWVKQRRCAECGFDVDADDPCCSAEPSFDEDDGHFAGLDSILADDNEAVMDQAEEAAQAAPAVFYECGACGGVHPSLETSEKLGLGWNGDCRDKNGHFEESDVPYEDNTLYISLEEQMSPDFDDTILASGESKTAVGEETADTCPNCGASVVDYSTYDEYGQVFCTSCGAELPMSQGDWSSMTDEASPDSCNHQPHDADTMQSVCEVCGQEIFYDPEMDYWTVLNAVEASAKTADTADNPANEADGDGAIKVKTDHDVAKTADTADNPANEHGGEGAMDPKTDKDKAKTADTADNPANEKGGEGAILPKTDAEVSKTAAMELKIGGRTLTPKYVIRIPGSTDAAWDVNSRGQLRGAGKPTNENLARYMEALLKSMEPGGHNEHLRGRFNPTEAAIYPNDGSYKNPLATWSKAEEPMFKVVEGADISGDISEAKSGVVSPDTVDTSIKQPTESVEEAGKHAADISGDISEAKSNTESPDTVDTDIKQPTVSVPEAAKEAAAGMPAEVGEFPYVETLVGMGWSDEGEPGHFMLNDSRVEVLTFTDGYQVFVDGELYEEGDNVDELQNTLEIVAELGTDALNAHQAADDKTACAGYGDEEDEERHIDLGIGDLADVVVEKEDAN